MARTIRFPYTATENDPTGLLPHFAVTLHHKNQSVDAVALLDTGSAVNVLPYRLGLELGAVWEEQQTPVPLVGSLGNADARAISLNFSHPLLTPTVPVRLIFAWTAIENAPLIFGQVNFFMEFEICFFRGQGVFEIKSKD